VEVTLVKKVEGGLKEVLNQVAILRSYGGVREAVSRISHSV
jgi:hypothetical protein